ncbi:MAG: rhomboid family intramembrane serine protease [candidate division KSB1 bacterium]|jgi:membrane associated rhomboid family serine protease|nr:rhomboid family intramembrane serine protease [candidate division KSB1 bacterium]
MIPIRDTIPSKRFPVVTVSLIIVNVIIFMHEMSLGSELNRFISAYGMVPARFFQSGDGESYSIIGRYYPFFTSIFLHGGWMHLIGNMWFLWIFGDNVEDRYGRFGFFLFYVFCGLLAGYAHALTNPQSAIPTVGASGAIAGVMGSYMLLYPRSRVLTLIPLFIFLHFAEIPAIFFLGIWFVFQFLSGTVDLAARSNAVGGVAWWAHIGGFLVGVFIAILSMIFKRK